MEPSTISSVSENDSNQKLLDACNAGDLKYLGEFIVGGGKLKDITDRHLRNALHYCVQNKDHKEIESSTGNLFQTFDRLKCARVIIKSNPEFMTRKDLDGLSPLHYATINGDLEFIKLLHEFNCDFQIKTGYISENEKTNIADRNSLHLSVVYTQIPVLRYLLTTNLLDCVNELDNHGATALHYAVQLNAEQSEEVIDLLINVGHANLDPSDGHGRTPLIWAATVGAKHSVHALLQKGANLNCRDAYGLTALHCAASRGHHEVVQNILTWLTVANADDPDRSAMFLDVQDNDGCSPLFYSVTMGHSRVTSCLLKGGANVNMCDSKGRTLCHCLARLNTTNRETSAKLIKTQLKDLLKAGIDPWKINNNGATALHEACLLKNVFLVKELSKIQRFDEFVNVVEADGHTPLQLVVASSWSSDSTGISLCQCLLENGANVNAVTQMPNGEYVTALDLACINETNVGKEGENLRNLLRHSGGKTYEELQRENDNVDGKITDEVTQSEKSIIPKHTDKKESAVQTEIIKQKSEKQSTKIIHSINKSSQTELNQIHLVKETQAYNAAHMDKKTSVSCMTLNQDTMERASSAISQEAESEVASVRKTTSYSSTCSLASGSSKQSKIESDKSQKKKNNIKNTKRSEVSGAHHRANSGSIDARVPFSQIYLERELPKVIRHYLDHDGLYSPVTGRSQMPKPTVSPYLLPVVPGLGTHNYRGAMRNAQMRKFSPHRKPMKTQEIDGKYGRSNLNSKKTTHSMPSVNTSHKVRSSSSSYSREHSGCHKSSTQFSSPQRGDTNRVQQSVLDYEFNRFIDQLLKSELKKTKPKQTISSPTKRAKRTEGMRTKHLTAVGGEISPTGRSIENSDSERSNSENSETAHSSQAKDHRLHKSISK